MEDAEGEVSEDDFFYSYHVPSEKKYYFCTLNFD